VAALLAVKEIDMNNNKEFKNLSRKMMKCILVAEM
jgi:hypothetical protein